jgi:hypothetical protein
MRIWGVLHIPKRIPALGIIFCHGFTGTRVETHQLFVHAARHLCEKGFAVLRFDFRGSGESEGLFQDMTISGEIEDLKTAISWILRRKEVVKDKIGVNGLSLGGVVTILTVAKDPRVKAVSIWSTPSDVSGFKQVEPDLPHRLLEHGYVDLSSGYRVGKAFFMDLGKHRITEAVSEIAPRPLLTVHGTKDDVVPLWNAERLYEAAGEPKEKFFVDGADHTYKRWDWQWTVIRHTADWFEKNLHQ